MIVFNFFLYSKLQQFPVGPDLYLDHVPDALIQPHGVAWAKVNPKFLHLFERGVLFFQFEFFSAEKKIKFWPFWGPNICMNL